MNLTATIAAALLGAPLLPCTSARAMVTEDVTQWSYTARPAQGDDLRDALNAATPIHRAGQRFHAYTSWNVTWNFWWNRDAAGRCRITRVKTRLTGTVQLPELQGGTPAQRQAFARYLRALRQHEEGHVQWGRSAAQAIDDGIALLPDAADCASLEQRANALARRVLFEHAAREKEYDRSTGYGATQGAQLPREGPID